MGLEILTLGSSKTYTRESLLGGGAVVGKNVTISSITPIEGGNKVTFSYTLDDGTVKTSSMNVMDGKDGIDGTNGKDGKDGQPGKDGSDGVGISKIEKISTVDLVDTYRITFTDNSTFDYEVKNGADGQGGGTADVPIEKIKVNGELQTPVNKVVDITVPDAYDDTALVQRISDIESDYAKTSEIPSKVSELENDSNYLSSIPEEYVTDTELEAKGYLTEHQDISNLVEKEDGKGLSSNDYTTEEKNKLAGLENYNDTALSNRVKSVEDEVPNLATKTYVGEQIANVEHLKREIVTVLPSDTEASDNIIYMLKVESTVGNDKYQEYMKIDGTVQMVGDTSVDLTDYAKTADVNESISALQTDKADASDLTAHTGDSVIHVTAENKTLWNTVEDKVDKTSIATALDDTVTDEQVVSALLSKTELDKKVDKTSIATTLSSESTNDEVVGAKLAYDELQKLESANKKQFNTASGESITVNDSVDGKIRDLKLYGKSEQKQYSGKNLLDCSGLTEQTLNGVTFTPVYENGMLQYIKANGTATDDCNFTLTNKSITEDGKTYKIVGCPSGGSSNTYRLSFWGGSSPEYGSGTIFTNEDLNVTYKYLYINIVSGYTCNNLVFKPMITTDLEATYDDFEPYVGGIPSPNPNYPQTINSVGDDGSLVIKSENKNILNIPDGSKDSNGITTTALNGRITCSGTSTAKFADVIHNISILFQSNNVYTFSIGKPIDCDISIKLHDSNGTALSDKRILKGNTSITFTAPENVARATFYIAGFESGTAISISNLCLQVEKGDIATLPVPHKETVSTIPLSEPLRAIGDIKDEITYQDGKWGVLRRIGSVDLGSFDWIYYSEYSSFKCVVSNKKESSICNKYTRIINWNDFLNVDYAYWSTLESVYIKDANGGTDATSFKESMQGTILQYELVTPTFEPLADQTLQYLSTYDGVTNISNDDALSAEMTVKYPTTDASGVGSRNESRIAELAKDTGDKFDDVNRSLVRVDKNTIANLCNSKNGNNIIIGQIKANTIYTLFFEQDSETSFNLLLNNSNGAHVSYKETSPTYSKTKVICWFSNTYDGNIFFNGWKGVNQRNFMIVEGKFNEWIDYITPTGNSGRLNVDVANLKNDLIVLEATSTIDMTASRELDDVTSALTIPSDYKPIAMYGYNSDNNDNISAIPLLVRSDGKVLFHAKNHSTSDQGTIHFAIRVTFKKMS